MLEGAAQLPFVFGVDPKFYPEILPSGPEATMHFGNLTVSKNALVIVITSFVLMGILWFIVQRTKMGKAMRAVSHDFDAAALMGINTDVVISFTFGLGAALAAAGGVLFGALTFKSILPLMGVQMGLKAFVAAVVGGIGSIPGAMLGGMLMGITESFVKGAPAIHIGQTTIDPSRWTDALAFAVFVDGNVEISPACARLWVWVTNFPLKTEQVYALANHGGRSRQSIECVFNVEKNGGFGLEHTYCANTTASQNYHLMMQVAFILWQLLAKGVLHKATHACRKITNLKLVELLGSSLRTIRITSEPKCFGQLRFNPSS